MNFFGFFMRLKTTAYKPAPVPMCSTLLSKGCAELSLYMYKRTYMFTKFIYLGHGGVWGVGGCMRAHATTHM